MGMTITIVPFYLGLLIFGIPAVRSHHRGALALALGGAFFFFLDPIQDTNGLGAFSSALGLDQLVLIAAFGLTFVVLAFGKGSGEAWPFWVIATGIAIHSFSESAALGEAVRVFFSNVTVALPGSASFVLHKFLEGFVLVAYCTASGAKKIGQVALAGIPMVLLSVSGGLASLLPSLDLSPFLASAAGGWMLVLVALGSQLEKKSRPLVIGLVVLGFIIVYSVGLLHSARFG